MISVEQVHGLVLGAGAHLDCEACGGELVPVNRLLTLIADDPSEYGIGVLAYVCSDCACLRLHAAHAETPDS